MSREKTAREPAFVPRREARLVPGGAEGAEGFRSPGHRRSAGGPPSSAHRLARAVRPARGEPGGGPDRQRSIRATLAVLLTIPLIALIALWAYAAITTIGPYIAQRNGNTINHNIGASSQALLLQLTQERTATLAWQSAHGALPRTSLDTQRIRTDAAVSAFRAGLTAAEGVLGPAGRASMANSLGQLGQLGTLRTEVNAGSIAPLAAFAAYNNMVDVYFQFVRTQLDVGDTSVALFQQGEGVVASGQALETIGREGALVGGALAAGGTMPQAEYRQFVEALDQQRFLEQTVNAPASWQLGPNPFQPFFASRTYQQFSALEDRIAAHGAGRVPVSAAAWRSGVQSAAAAFGQAEGAAIAETTKSSAHVGNVILLRLILVGGAGLAAVLISAFLLLRFGNRITRELTGFHGAVRALAEERLPDVVARLSRGGDVDVATEAPPLALRTRTLEVTRIADGFSAMQQTAVAAAVGQADLRKGVSNVFRSLARRNQSLLQRQLRMLDDMERSTEDPDTLAQLFRLDHLTTRMRRQSEGLIILSGSLPGRRWSKPVPVLEVLRGAIGEIEDYVRVDLAADSRELVSGAAVADLTHLLAELIENAALYSPPHTRVQVKTSQGGSGFIIEIEDRGLGIPAGTLAVLNDRLARPPEFDLADSDQLGLLVVSRLAIRHGIRVTLRGSPFGGAAAIVLIPHRLVVSEDEAAAEPALPAPRRPAPAQPDGPSAVAYAPVTRPPLPRAAESAGQPAGPSGDRPALPRRQRQASLAPQLRDAPPKGLTAPDPAASAARSAEQVRDLMSSVQRGWRSGRARAEQAADPPGEWPTDANPGPDGLNGHGGPR